MKNAKTSAPTPSPMEIIVFFVLADGIVNESLLSSLSQVASTCQGESKAFPCPACPFVER